MMNQEKSKQMEFPGFIVRSPNMLHIIDLAADLSQCDYSRFYLTGPSGCGKEFFARYLYALFRLKGSGDFVAINCSGLNPNLAHSELFGHVKNIFNNAIEKTGFFEILNPVKGTLFLDEVADLPEEVQPMLLRAIQLPYGSARKLGGTKDYSTTDLFIISATDQSLSNIRPALLNRFGYPIEIPGLDERPEDVPGALLYFIEETFPSAHLIRMVRQMGISVPDDFRLKPRMSYRDKFLPLKRFLDILCHDLTELTLSRSWRKGNFRSLLNCVRFALARTRSFESMGEFRSQIIQYFSEAMLRFSESRPVAPAGFREGLDSSLCIDVRQLEDDLWNVFPKTQPEKREIMARFLVSMDEFTTHKYHSVIRNKTIRNSQNQLSVLVKAEILIVTGKSIRRFSLKDPKKYEQKVQILPS
ncbi:MAG TPA: sigma 54-interacting transcriptional regulator [Prolixibacteraceae bacterium]|nr:sigma 54-interacting transcriptional regulator [Prolixibacteraceae bacterium]